MTKTIPNRIVIYTKDVMNITGRKERAAKKLMAQMRKQYKKKRGGFISVEEFCQFTGLKEERVSLFLVN